MINEKPNGCSLQIRGMGLVALCCLCVASNTSAEQPTRLKYNNPGLVVDLGVGLWAWPLPMDYDGDGDLDLLVACPDKPYRGTYFFENTGRTQQDEPGMPIFKPGVRIAEARSNMQVSYVEEQPIVTTPGQVFPAFADKQFEMAKPLPIDSKSIHSAERIRANQWKLCDWDGDGVTDLLIGIGDWEEYGWDNAFDASGDWTRGPLHGYVYVVRNQGTNDEPEYADPTRIQAGDRELDVFGMPSPNAADFDGDGDLDLICGEFLDGLTYFENVGTRTEPKLSAGRRLTDGQHEVKMDLQMIVPTAIDWDRDGDVDLIVGDEDGRVAFVEHMGQSDSGVPQFSQPKYFRQEADEVKFGALITPVSVDWDADGDEDLICGNTAGYLGFIENLDGGNPPRWAAPRYLTAEGENIRIQAGPNGSIQGPCEAKWGYTTIDVGDWDGDGLNDVIANSIWGKIVWFRNVGSATQPMLSPAQEVHVNWNDSPPYPAWNWWQPGSHELATQWRTTPIMVDWDQDGKQDLVMLDHEGYLALFHREIEDGTLTLTPGQRLFHGESHRGYDSLHRVKTEGGGLLQLNTREAGASGRRKLALVDWDLDGDLDLLANSRSINLLTNIAQKGNEATFRDDGLLTDYVLAGHTTSPTCVDWDKDGRPDLLIGAEDGYLYYLPRSADE